MPAPFRTESAGRIRRRRRCPQWPRRRRRPSSPFERRYRRVGELRERIGEVADRAQSCGCIGRLRVWRHTWPGRRAGGAGRRCRSTPAVATVKPMLGRTVDGNAVDHDRCAECLEDSMRRRLRFFDGSLDEHREFVTTKPGDGALFAQRSGEPPGDPDKQLVAGRMAQGVVDRFEVVQVEAQHRDRCGVVMSTGDGLFQSVEEVSADWADRSGCPETLPARLRTTGSWFSTSTTNCRASTAATRIPSAASIGPCSIRPTARPNPTAAASSSGR